MTWARVDMGWGEAAGGSPAPTMWLFAAYGAKPCVNRASSLSAVDGLSGPVLLSVRD